MEAYRSNQGKALFILNLGASWRCVVNFTTRPLCTQVKDVWFSLHIRWDRTRSLSGCFGEEK